MSKVDFDLLEKRQNYFLGDFVSSVSIHQPDKEAYHKQKGVYFIDCSVKPITDNPPKIDSRLTSWVGDNWYKFHGPMISGVLNGSFRDNKNYPKVFPGSIISGPLHTNQNIGCTAWETFIHMLSIPQRVIDVKKLYLSDHHYHYVGERPKLEVTDLPLSTKWNWEIDQPKLFQMQLSVPNTPYDECELNRKKGALLNFIADNVIKFIEDGDKMDEKEFIGDVRKLLELSQIVQSPYVKNEIPEKVVLVACAILKERLLTGNTDNILPAIFQLESSLMYAHHLEKRDPIAHGVFGHSWIDVAKTPIEDLKSTETVDEKRVIDEVENLIIRGWAPIITDENINNTDGSHRGIAARVWSLLKNVYINGEICQDRVASFVSRRTDMRGLTLRETLRVIQELFENHKYSDQLKLIIETLPYRPGIDYVPTILLREQEACCVVKNPFDNEGKIIGVDPFVTFSLTNGRNDLALGSRGPYHRTDKTPAPWFNVFEMQ